MAKAKRKKNKALSDADLYAMLVNYINQTNALKDVRGYIQHKKKAEKIIQAEMDALSRELRRACNRGPTGKKSFVLRGSENPIVVELTARTVRVIGAVNVERLRH